MKQKTWKQEWQENTYMRLTIGLVLILGLLLTHSYTTQEETIPLGDFEITESDLTAFLDTFGGQPFQLCNTKTGSCYVVRAGV